MICSHCRATNIETARFCESCGKPLKPAAPENLSGLHTVDPELERRSPPADPRSPFDLQPDHVFAGRYRIVTEIGRGGMGVVYRAHDTVTDRDVALKLIRGDRLAGKDAVKRLIREGVLARDIRHRNVVAVYDVGEIGGLPFLSMEMLEGGSLRAWTQARMRAGEECTMATAANIVREILAGLEAAHGQGVIHRDLKPENIVLLSEPSDQRARLKILDFGIARAAGGSETGSTSLGTLEYMSPEQITAPEAVQASADFYSLSVMFYELLIGVVPKGHWQPPSGGRSDVPPAIDKLIERGLSNNPRQRPQDAATYRAELEAALAPPQQKPHPQPTPPPQPQPPPAPAASTGEARPRPAPAPPPSEAVKGLATPRNLAIGGVVLAVLAGGAFFAMSQGGQQQAVSYSLGPSDNHVATPPAAPPQPEPVAPQPQPFAQPLAQPEQPAQQVGPPDVSNYPLLSGFWVDDFQNYIQVSVSWSGQVAGAVTSGPLTGYALQGQFEQTFMSYGVGNAQGMGAQSMGEWVDACHIEYLIVDAYGQPTGQTSMIHVNHFPNDPCP